MSVYQSNLLRTAISLRSKILRNQFRNGLLLALAAATPVFGQAPVVQGPIPNNAPATYNWPRPSTQAPNADGGATQSGFENDPQSEADATKYRQLPQRPEDMQPSLRQRFDTHIASIQEPDVRLDLIQRRSKLITTKQPIVRVSIAEPGIVETVNFSPNEFELIGRDVGETTVTLWFGEPQATPGHTPLHSNIRYLVKVHPDLTEDDVRRTQYGELAKRINELFPNSHVQLIAVADKLVVRGQARDAQEATAIMSVIRGEAVDQSGGLLGPGSNGGGFGAGLGPLGRGRAARLAGFGANDWASNSVISMLEVPGEHQVLLKVRIARLNRGALRTIGSTFSGQAGDFSISTNLATVGAYQAVLSSTDVQLTLSALSSNRTTKVLAEPNLVTISGYPVYFIDSGQFAVPTVLGINGVAGTVNQFQGYGTQLQFTPTVLDKDHIRLQVAPTVSQISTTTGGVNGIPSLDVQSVYTQVNLREGQWLAIAGLIQDKQDSSKVRVPWIGDIPGIDLFFSRRSVARDETELVILVSPELVHPLEPEQVPMVLPGMEVTEPDDLDFFLLGRYEGRPDLHHRSTVWPLYQWSTFEARTQAIWGAKQSPGYGSSTGYYMQGPTGFSN